MVFRREFVHLVVYFLCRTLKSWKKIIKCSLLVKQGNGACNVGCTQPPYQPPQASPLPPILTASTTALTVSLHARPSRLLPPAPASLLCTLTAALPPEPEASRRLRRRMRSSIDSSGNTTNSSNTVVILDTVRYGPTVALITANSDGSVCPRASSGEEPICGGRGSCVGECARAEPLACG